MPILSYPPAGEKSVHQGQKIKTYGILKEKSREDLKGKVNGRFLGKIMMKCVTVLPNSSYGGHIGRVSLAHIEGICRLDGLLVMGV